MQNEGLEIKDIMSELDVLVKDISAYSQSHDVAYGGDHTIIEISMAMTLVTATINGAISSQLSDNGEEYLTEILAIYDKMLKSVKKTAVVRTIPNFC